MNLLVDSSILDYLAYWLFFSSYSFSNANFYNLFSISWFFVNKVLYSDLSYSM